MLGGLFLYLANANNRDFLPQISELDLSLTQLKALFQLDGRSKELSMREISEGLGLSLATTSRTVDGLCKRRLVTRDEDPEDRRMKRVRLTAKGQATIDRVAAVRIATLQRLVETLSAEEREGLAAGLEPILDRDDVRRFYRKGKPR
jgi:DNA-binding MarR family transcriptional regulator